MFAQICLFGLSNIIRSYHHTIIYRYIICLYNAYCTHRFDKYENKQLYWVEEELKAEWEKLSSESIRQETEYQTDTNAMDAMGASLTGLEFAPDAGPSVPEGE